MDILKDIESQDHTSATSGSSIPRDISVVTPEGEEKSSSLFPNYGGMTSSAKVSKQRRKKSDDVGDRLYQQAKQSVKRKEENAARFVDENETFSPKLVAKQVHNSIKRSSPFQRLYSLASMKQSLQRKRIEASSSLEPKKSKGSKKTVFSAEKAADLYERGRRSQEETRARNNSIASSLLPTFTPTKFTNRSSASSPVTPTTPRTNNTQHAGNRLYEQGKGKMPTTPQHVPSPSSDKEQCTFKPDISMSQRHHPSHVVSPVFQRLRVEKPVTPQSASFEKKDYTFKPDISASQKCHPSPLASSVFQRLQKEGNLSAQKRMQDWHETKSVEGSLKGRKGGKAVVRSSARIDDLYQIGLKKERGRRHSDAEEREARDRKREESELQRCTFRPRTHWTEEEEVEPDIPDMIPLEIETHTHDNSHGAEEVSQLNTDGSTYGGGDHPGDEIMILEKQRMDDRPDHVNIGNNTPKSMDVVGFGAEDMEETDSIGIGSI